MSAFTFLFTLSLFILIAYLFIPVIDLIPVIIGLCFHSARPADNFRVASPPCKLRFSSAEYAGEPVHIFPYSFFTKRDKWDVMDCPPLRPFHLAAALTGQTTVNRRLYPITLFFSFHQAFIGLLYLDKDLSLPPLSG
jgi:hypothetical protein